jgi:type I restriction enzyme S subunit
MSKWNVLPFGVLIRDDTRHAKKIKLEDYLSEGKYQIIDQGQGKVAGYANDEGGLYEDVPAIIFGDHTRIVKYVDRPFFLGADGVKLLKAENGRLDYKFLYYFFLSSNIPDTGYNRHFKWLKSLLIPVPPIKTQKHIANILDKNQEIIDGHKKQLEELDNLIESYFYNVFGDPVANEQGWKIQTLKDVCNRVTDGTHNSPPNYAVGEYKYITAKNIKRDGFDFSNLTYISEADHKEIYDRCNPELGDVLYIKDGVTTGIAQINTLHEKFSLLSSVALLKQKREVVNEYYLREVLNDRIMYANIRTNMGGAAITRLTVHKIELIQIPVPPMAIQTKFAEIVTQIENQKSLVKQSLVESQNLFNSLMSRYFD